jgi:hypothetical protein
MEIHELPLRNQLNLARPCRTDLLLDNRAGTGCHSRPLSSYEGFRVTGNALKKLLGIAAHIGPIVYSSWSFCDVREGIPGTIGPRLHCSGPASLL